MQHLPNTNIKVNMIYDNLYLVVLYNKSMAESTTIKSIVSSKIDMSKVKVVVWNNGPRSIEEEFSAYENKKCSVNKPVFSLEESIHNESLSRIYNKFLASNISHRYTILDDDSILDDSYFFSANTMRSDKVGCPLIRSGSKLCNPKIGKVVLTEKGTIPMSDNFMTIGSGIVIGASVVNDLLGVFNRCFDEKFYFYGVDTTFIRRLRISSSVSKIDILPEIKHSISITEKESSDLNHFRIKERSYDLGLQYRYYKSNFVSTCKFIAILCSLLFKRPKYYSICYIIKAYATGKHYRN